MCFYPREYILRREFAMRHKSATAAIGLALMWITAPCLTAQDRSAAPLYRVTVESRTTQAISYQYRNGTTQVDLRGTVLLPRSEGEAKVESRQGRTTINASVRNLPSAQRFGREYLTYVLWAITPQGKPYNLGELISGPSDKARMRVTTPIQTFALIVTAEPYAYVRQPGNVVVMENQVSPETVGTIQPVKIRYELLPRGSYTYEVPAAIEEAGMPKVSMHQYVATLALYQAQNALGLARVAGAPEYAPEVYRRAEQSYENAKALNSHGGDYRTVVQTAREATESAADAREIALSRKESAQLRSEQGSLARKEAQLQSERAAREAALQQANQAQAEANRAMASAQQAEAARRQAEAAAAAAEARAAQAQARQRASEAATLQRQDSRRVRGSLIHSLAPLLPTLDSARGVVVTVPDSAFRGADLRGGFVDDLEQVGTVLSAHPELNVSVQGYSATAANRRLSEDRAETVRQKLIAQGVKDDNIQSAGLGDRRPVASNLTEEGRQDNSRVEIVITGTTIGALPLWDHPYALMGQRR